MRKGENPSEVLTDIKERIDRLNASVLPKGVKIVPYYDRSWLIATTLTTVFRNLLEGGLLVTLVLYIFLRNGRAAGIVALMIPLSLLATFIGLRLRGIPANLLSLGAMDFGIIVDGAVIVVENVFRTLAERGKDAGTLDRATARSAILDATTQVGRPTLFSMLIIIVAHIPIFTLQRHEGRIFAPMAYTVSSALVGSLLVLADARAAAVLLPARARREARGQPPGGRAAPRVSPGADARHRPAGARGRRARSWLSSPPWRWCRRLGSEFLPELNEGTMWVNVLLPPSVSVAEASRLCARIRGIIRDVSRGHAGHLADRHGPKTAPIRRPINMAEFFVDLKPPSEWTRKISREDLVGANRGRGRQGAGTRSGDVAADSRQRAREHLADRRADRDQGLRRRPDGAPTESDGGAARRVEHPWRVACLHRSRSGRFRSCRSKSTVHAPPDTASMSRTSKTSSTPRSAARSRPKSGKASGDSASPCACSERDRTRHRRHQQHPRRHAVGPARPACGGREPVRAGRQHEHQPGIGHAPRRDCRVHPRPRHGRHRR